jgi:hypothetical protein
MRSLHNVHEMNAYRVGHVCLSIRMIQLENHWMDLDEIWYGRYAIGDYPKLYFTIFYNRNTNMVDEQTCEVRSILAPLAKAIQ